jgi:hypothetical protein
MKYCVYKIPNVGIGIIPEQFVPVFKQLVPIAECIFTGTYRQCMVYVIEPISLN